MKHKTKWTPGPWHAQDRGIGWEVHLGDSAPENGWGNCVNDGFRETFTEADARLISASPDLYEALESIENDDGRIPMEIWNMRNLALAKARGAA